MHPQSSLSNFSAYKSNPRSRSQVGEEDHYEVEANTPLVSYVYNA
jgi:hypothetical protein